MSDLYDFFLLSIIFSYNVNMKDIRFDLYRELGIISFIGIVMNRAYIVNAIFLNSIVARQFF